MQSKLNQEQDFISGFQEIWWRKQLESLLLGVKVHYNLKIKQAQILILTKRASIKLALHVYFKVECTTSSNLLWTEVTNSEIWALQNLEMIECFRHYDGHFYKESP